MTKEQIQHALWSILVGAATIFISALLQGLLDFLKAHAADILGGTAATLSYLMRTYKNS